MSIEAIGCCGAYCGTCKELKAGVCKGCKFGYWMVKEISAKPNAK